MHQYREAQPSDLEAICQLGEVVNLLHHEAWPHIFSGAGDPDRHSSHWQQSIGGERSTTFVCEYEGTLVGFVTVLVAQDSSSLLQPHPYARVGSICVVDGHRKKGIGRALMALAEQWAVDRCAQDLRLHVWDFNDQAMALYAELGYEIRSHVLGKRLQKTDA